MKAKVTFWLKHCSGLILSKWTTLDCIIAGARYRRLVHQIPIDEAIEQSIEIPIRKINTPYGWFYAASHGQYEIKGSEQMTFTRAQTSVRYLRTFGYGLTDKIMAGGGIEGGADGTRSPYKTANYALVIEYTDKVDFIADFTLDSIEEIEEYMKSIGITNIGKKASMGFGLVKEIEVEKVDKDTVITRHIPYGLDYDYQYPIIEIRLLPPLWLREGRQLCGIAGIK